jgi:Domain of unknown function (DUF4365)
MASTVAQEHLGIAKVHTICAMMEAIWRSTIGTDLGVDGQIEFLEFGKAVSTGRIIAVQIKSGPSYFKNENKTSVPYYPAAKHRLYWDRLNLPVILVLHNPDSDLTIYANVKRQIRDVGPISVPKSQLLRRESRQDLIDIAQAEAYEYLGSPRDALANFREITFAVGMEKQISGIEFLLACTSLQGRFLELRMGRIVELLGLADPGVGVLIGEGTYSFILRCVMKCWRWGMCESFEAEFDRMWWDLEMVPDIAVPLTEFGVRVLECLWSNVDEYLHAESFEHMKPASSLQIAQAIAAAAEAVSRRIDASDKLGEWVK